MAVSSFIGHAQSLANVHTYIYTDEGLSTSRNVLKATPKKHIQRQTTR